MASHLSPRPEVLAFLNDSKRNPESDDSRLILADWLEERGDPRGALLRLQCEQGSLSTLDYRWQPLTLQIHRLIGEHQSLWQGPLIDPGEDWGWSVTFDRGLSHLVTPRLPSEKVLRQWEQSEAFAWVEKWTLNFSPDKKMDYDSRALGFLTGISSFYLRSPESLCRLLESKPLTGPVDLALGELEWGDQEVESLAGSEGLCKVKGLTLNGSGLHRRLLSKLLRSPFLSDLCALDLSMNLMCSEDLSALTEQKWHRLTSLSFRCTEELLSPDTAGAAALAGCSMPQLKHLSLPNMICTTEQARAMSTASFLPGVEDLDLSLSRARQSWTGIGDEGAVALATQGSPSGCRRLSMGCQGIGDLGTQALASALPSIVELDLSNNQIGSAGLIALLSSSQMPELRYLDLKHNRTLYGQNLRELSELEKRSLLTLELNVCGLQDPQAMELAHCPSLSSLTSLNLNGNDVTEVGAEELLTSPFLKNLRRLTLQANPIDERAADRLRDEHGERMTLWLPRPLDLSD